MEFVEGETLADRLRATGPTHVAERGDPHLFPCARGPGLRARAACDSSRHQAFEHHADAEGVAKLTDFGIARGLDTPYSTVKGKRPLGTPEYMSPDRIRGWKADPRADIYSMGITLYQMLTGRVPFPRAKDTDDYIPVLTAHLFQHANAAQRAGPGDSCLARSRNFEGTRKATGEALHVMPGISGCACSIHPPSYQDDSRGASGVGTCTRESK